MGYRAATPAEALGNKALASPNQIRLPLNSSPLTMYVYSTAGYLGPGQQNVTRPIVDGQLSDASAFTFSRTHKPNRIAEGEKNAAHSNKVCNWPMLTI